MTPPICRSTGGAAGSDGSESDTYIAQSNYSRGFIATPWAKKTPVRVPSHGARDHGRMSDSAIPTTDITGVPEVIPSDLVVLDVREPHEWAAGHIEGAVHIPMGEIPARVGELDPSAPTLVVCHVGGRSARVTAWLH